MRERGAVLSMIEILRSYSKRNLVQDVEGSLFGPAATIFSISAGSGLCNCNAIEAGAVIQVSTSSRVVKIAGIAFE
jgi:hypothetical protein